jgi:hypothetical protein
VGTAADFPRPTVRGARLLQARNDDCRATCRAIASAAAELTRDPSRPQSLDPDFTDWRMSTRDERIVMVADDEDFLEWQRDWLADNGRD